MELVDDTFGTQFCQTVSVSDLRVCADMLFFGAQIGIGGRGAGD